MQGIVFLRWLWIKEKKNQKSLDFFPKKLYNIFRDMKNTTAITCLTLFFFALSMPSLAVEPVDVLDEMESDGFLADTEENDFEEVDDEELGDELVDADSDEAALGDVDSESDPDTESTTDEQPEEADVPSEEEDEDEITDEDRENADKEYKRIVKETVKLMETKMDVDRKVESYRNSVKNIRKRLAGLSKVSGGLSAINYSSAINNQKKLKEYKKNIPVLVSLSVEAEEKIERNLAIIDLADGKLTKKQKRVIKSYRKSKELALEGCESEENKMDEFTFRKKSRCARPRWVDGPGSTVRINQKR